MAINKEKNVLIQVTFPKEDAEQLDTLVGAFNKEGIKCNRSSVLRKALNEYIKMLVASATLNKVQEKAKKENKEEKINA